MVDAYAAKHIYERPLIGYYGSMSANQPSPHLSDHAKRAVELLLASIFWHVEDGRIHKFLYGAPDRLGMNMGVEIQYSRHRLQDCALYVRENAPSHMRYLPVADIEAMLKAFVSTNFWIVSREVFGATFSCSFGDFVSSQVKAAWAEMIEQTEIFKPSDLLTVYPIVPLRTEADLDVGIFFLIAPDSLTGKLPPNSRPDLFAPSQFPPYKEHAGVKYRPASWLGIRTATSHAARKAKATVLGALALIPHRFERFLFTGRDVFGGFCTIGDTFTFSFGSSHTPALSEDIVLTKADHAWLTMLAQKMASDDPADRRQTKALEYFYRAWMADNAVERFPTLFMALDALYGERNKTTRTITEGVLHVMQGQYSEKRVRDLISLRGEVIHGTAPDVCESDEYHAYYVEYGENPIPDLELIAARCLQTTVFSGKLEERPHTYADLMRLKTGRIV